MWPSATKQRNPKSDFGLFTWFSRCFVLLFQVIYPIAYHLVNRSEERVDMI